MTTPITVAEIERITAEIARMEEFARSNGGDLRFAYLPEICAAARRGIGQDHAECLKQLRNAYEQIMTYLGILGFSLVNDPRSKAALSADRDNAGTADPYAQDSRSAAEELASAIEHWSKIVFKGMSDETQPAWFRVKTALGTYRGKPYVPMPEELAMFEKRKVAVSTPRDTDCPDIREGRLVVLSRFDCPEDPELDGKPSMTMRYINTPEDKKDG